MYRQALIKNESVLVFSKTYCPHCAKVKALFKDLETDFELVELDERRTSYTHMSFVFAAVPHTHTLLSHALADGAEIQALLLDLTKQRTVPNVFIKGQHIGGADATLALHASNKLVPLLQ